MTKISFIVTVYNKQDYIRQCVESLIYHKLHYDVEIIIVNDGSSDKSKSIIESLCIDYPEIVFLDQNNQGLSMARNNGTSIATGDYIWFIDADDYISEDFIPEEVFMEEPDVLVLQSKWSDSTVIRNKIDLKYSKGFEVLTDNNWCACAPFYIFRRSFLLKYNLQFVKGIIHEDAEFTPRALYLAKKLKIINKPLYIVFPAPNSITRSQGNYKRSTDIILIASSLLQFEKEHKMRGREKKSFDSIIARFINSGLRNVLLCTRKEQSDYNHLLSKKQEIIAAFWNSTKLKYKIEYLLFMLVRNYIKVFKMIN